MRTDPLTWTTPVLARSLWPQVVRAAVDGLAATGRDQVEWLHGWATPTELEAWQWQTETLPCSALRATLHGRERPGFVLGEADLHWSGEGWEVLLCHEGDLHLSTGDEGLVAELRRRLAAVGVPLDPAAERGR